MRFSTRQAATLALLGWALGAAAATTDTAVTGTKGITDQGCLQLLTISVSDGENCMYNGGPAQLAFQPGGEVTGPYSQASYYDSATTPGAFNPAFVPAPGDGKIEQVVSGTVTIDDAGTPGDDSDDLISFTLTLTSPGGGDIIRFPGSGVVDRYTSMTQVLTDAAVSTATPNAQGGYDYVIGSQGFPSLLTFNEDPCDGQPFGSMDCSASFAAASPDPDRWSGSSVAGIGSLEGNVGVRTTGSLQGYQCAQAATQCTTSSISFGPKIADPGNAAREDVGWDQLVLRVSTNANGNVLTLAGFDVQEYTVFGPPPPCGSDPGATSACNSWVSGYFTATGEAGPPGAHDDVVTAFGDGSVDIDVAANDIGFGYPRQIHIYTVPLNGTATVRPPEGDEPSPVVVYEPVPGFRGTDTFQYAIDDGSILQTATVTVHVVDDTDGDGIPDPLDNCTLVANPDQRDTDDDGYGNVCDGDLSNDGVVNFLDLALLRSRFGSAEGDADLDGNGIVNFADLARFQGLFGKPPGPSGPASGGGDM